jgi:hypothetical protein
MHRSRRSHALFGIRRRKVTYVAIANSKVLRSRRAVRGYLRVAGVVHSKKKKKRKKRSLRR